LIPTATLNLDAKGAVDNPPHDVHQHLIKGKELYADTDYDINSSNNGKWMPYAHRLQEWVAGLTKENAKKLKQQILEDNTDLTTLVMTESKIQIHQGAHSHEKYGSGESGYLTRVDLYLDKVLDNAISHFEVDSEGNPVCEDCSGNEKAGLYSPRSNTVRFVEKVSTFIKSDINQCRIFVSEAASKFNEYFGFIKEKNK
jgi:hypothetical protein